MHAEHWMKNLNLIARFKISKPESGPLQLKKRRDFFKKLGLEWRIILK